MFPVRRLVTLSLLLSALVACRTDDAIPQPLEPPEPPGELGVSLEATPLEGAAPLSVTFSASATGYTPDYLWDFGDGASRYDAATVTYTYTEPGAYTASVSVGGSEDLISDEVQITVR